MTEVRELTCIRCPMGCGLSVKIDGENIEVTGNTCPNGAKYGAKEVTNPTRIVTSSVVVEGGTLPRVPVKTRDDIPKGKMMAIMEEIRACRIKAPVHIGDVVIRNCAGTGVDIVAARDIA